MKKNFFLIVFIIMVLSSFIFSQINQNQIIIGKIDSLYSDILKESRKVMIYSPTMTSSETQISKRYPVLYLFDGTQHFLSTVGIIQQLSQVNGNSVFPEMIVVGIINTNRNRDLTPAPYPNDSTIISGYGGGEKFTAFMENELIPFIDSHYSTHPYRILVGHSFGGLMAINTLVNHSHLFNCYVAIDPSFWEVKQKLFNEYISAMHRNKYDKKKLFIAMANTFDTLDTMTVRKDTSQTYEHPST